MPAGLPLDSIDPATNPRLAALLAYWRLHVDERGLVHKRHFNPFDLQPWLGYLSIFEKVGEDYRIRLDGSEIVRMTGEEWTGRWVSDADKHYNISLIASLKIMVAENRPIFHAVHFIATKPFMTVGRLILPLSNDGQAITHVAVALLPNAGSQAS